MEEIAYWVHTKRAPCLMLYDSMQRKAREAPATSSQVIIIHSISDTSDVPPEKKPKCTILDDDSAEKVPQNLYFDTSNPKITQQKTLSSYELSDLDFNITRSSNREKPRKKCLQKSKSVMHKKNMIITSTPKSNPRRSVRNVCRKLKDDEMPTSRTARVIPVSNGEPSPLQIQDKSTAKANLCNKVRDISSCSKIINSKTNVKLNKKLDDVSDMSGFTANYIRSTKLKPKSGSRNKHNGSLVKESQLLAVSLLDKTPVSPRKKCLRGNRLNDSMCKPEISAVHTRSSQSLSQPQKQQTTLVLDDSADQIDADIVLNATNSGSKGRKSTPKTPSRPAPRRARPGRPARAGRPRPARPGRDKSGFSACFSDSDDDKPLTAHRTKYFS